jgi:peroxiredoxin
MQAWAKDQKIGLSMLKFMGDPLGDLTKALDMELTDEGVVNGKGLIGRCKRHVVYAVNGEIKSVQISEGPGDPAGDDNPSLSMPENMIEVIKGIK